jgi:TPP-dependent 2-oxoacid decarboxylase
MSEPLSVSQALLNAIPPVTDTTWTEAFDKVLTDVLQQCRPGYVEIPTDAVHHKVSSKGLKTPPVSYSTTWSSVLEKLIPGSPTLGPSPRSY